MLEYIITGITAIIIYQILTITIYLLSKESEIALVITSTLFPLAILYTFYPLYKNIRLAYYKRNYNCYRLCYTKKDGTKDKSLYVFYAKHKNIKDFSQNENDKYYIELHRKGKDFKSAPYSDDIYKGQEHFKGWDMSLFKTH